MPLLLPLLPVGSVAAIEAAGGGAKHAVMTGEMAGGTSDDGALDAALGIGGGSGRERQRRDGEHSKYGSHDHVSEVNGCHLNGSTRPWVPAHGGLRRP